MSTDNYQVPMHNPSPAELHRKAAEHLQQAAEHHEKAARSHETSNHDQAARYAQTAHAHYLRATDYANQAIKQHVTPTK